MPGKNQFKYSRAELLRSSRKFKHRSDWSTDDCAYFQAARRQGPKFFALATKHMVKKIPCIDGVYSIYAFEFEAINTIYVGLSQNPETRRKTHKYRNTKLSHLLSQNYPFVFKIVAKNLTPQEAVNSETAFANDYEARGWKVLNCKHALGILGASRLQWPLDRITKSAKQYKTYADWCKHDRKAVEAAKRQRITAKIKTAYFPNTKKWPKDAILASTTDYATFSKWSRAKRGALKSAIRNGWLEEIRRSFKKHNKHWTKQMLIDSASNYTSRYEWYKKESGAYEKARTMGCISEVAPHIPKRTPRSSRKKCDITG